MSAQQRGPDNIVVERFRGRLSAEVRQWLIEGLEGHDDYSIMSNRTFTTAVRARYRRPRPGSPARYAAMAEQLDIRAFISGRLVRRGGQWVLLVEVRDGETGRVVGDARWANRRRLELQRVRVEAWDELGPLIEQAWSPARSRTPPPPPEVETPPEPEPTAEPQPEPEDDDEPETPRRQTRRMDAFRVELLFSSLRRNMRANTLVDPTLRGQPAGAAISEAHRFRSSGLGHSELGFRLELYPGAVFPDQVTWGFFGFYLEFRTSILLRTSMRACSGQPRCTASGSLVNIDSRTTDLNMGIRLRHRFGSRRHSPTILGDVGYGIFHYFFDPEDLATADPRDILPPMKYRHLHIGAGLEAGIVPTYLSFVGRFHYRLGTQIGQAAREIWGLETTSLSGIRMEVQLKTEMPYLLPGLYASIAFEFFRWRTTFRGQTQCNTNITADCSLWEPWPTDNSGRVTGGIPDPVSDNYFRLGLNVGYAFQ